MFHKAVRSLEARAVAGGASSGDFRTYTVGREREAIGRFIMGNGKSYLADFWVLEKSREELFRAPQMVSAIGVRTAELLQLWNSVGGVEISHP